MWLLVMLSSVTLMGTLQLLEKPEDG